MFYQKNPGFTQHLFSKAHVAPEGPGLKVGGKSSVLSHKLGSEAASPFGQGAIHSWVTCPFTGGPRTITVAGKRLPVSLPCCPGLVCREGEKGREPLFAFGGGSGDCSCQCEVPTTHNIYIYIYTYILYICILYIYIMYFCIYIYIYIFTYICTYYTSSTAQGGGGSFKDRKL